MRRYNAHWQVLSSGLPQRGAASRIDQMAGIDARAPRRQTVWRLAVAALTAACLGTTVCIVAPPRIGQPACYWAGYEGVCISDGRDDIRSVVLRDQQGTPLRSPRLAITTDTLVYWEPQGRLLRVVRSHDRSCWLAVRGWPYAAWIDEIRLDGSIVRLCGHHGTTEWETRLVLNGCPAADTSILDSRSLEDVQARRRREPARPQSWPLRRPTAMVVEVHHARVWTTMQLPFHAGWELWLSERGTFGNRCRVWSTYPMRRPFGTLTPEIRRLFSLAADVPGGVDGAEHSR